YQHAAAESHDQHADDHQEHFLERKHLFYVHVTNIAQRVRLRHKKHPNPEVFVKAAEYLHPEPSDCLVVEDAAPGIEAALSSSFICAEL
ncbi:MAG: HAD-IA family hydrolase, partial [Erysipelotrichaceae bacterium]|nr:HAD-IA family hydrolase [Erysipelotrichaceae bacterium]